MKPSGTPLPKAEYQARRVAREAASRRLDRREGLAGFFRFLTFLAILAAIYASWAARQLLPLWLGLAVAAFVLAVYWHRRVVRSLERSHRAIRYYVRAIDRLDDRWSGRGPDGQRYLRPEHLYANDLDLFGRGSLFQWLCAARTRVGQDTLADWLLAPASTDEVRARQAAVEELRPSLDLRESFAVLDAPTAVARHPQSLRDWVTKPALLADRVRPVLALVLACLSVATLAGWLFDGTRLSWFVIVVIFQGLFLLEMRRPMTVLSAEIHSALSELNLLTQMLQIIEVQQYSSPLLREIVARLHPEGVSSSRRIARLARLAETWETICHNQFVGAFAFVLLLYVHLAYAIERWRLRNRQAVLQWLEAVGQFEALCSLAGYAFEHPEHPFPEIIDDAALLEAQSLGHPLIPAKRRVTNDVRLGVSPRLLLVTGSNMSGKSTLLRTVGINTVLALAGAPVCAASMRVSPLGIATAMRKVDSLQEGVSGFYAEIRRLRAICDRAAQSPPVLFLLDEILHGTNSYDRRLGADAVIESLLRQEAVGLVTTHDLALAEIAQRRSAEAVNVHFEDQLVDGKISFDYHLRPGVVPKGNGLVLMRLLGFQVAEEQSAEK